jgi:hypothetical protein
MVNYAEALLGPRRPQHRNNIVYLLIDLAALCRRLYKTKIICKKTLLRQ